MLNATTMTVELSGGRFAVAPQRYRSRC